MLRSYPNALTYGHAHGDCDPYGYTNTDCYSDANFKRNTPTTASPNTKAAPDRTASPDTAPGPARIIFMISNGRSLNS